ncbi:hypothetical protein BDN71DRAFT_1261743 [Pleurotus eryngii]|uniref:Uncharacterized protein n=1 Tax=Pleurotus eryngii TaxID=5323 RepID=A0A9P6A6B3_PLEER|nr:hypothetical protein BDN71DRAFT_1261743 [Pleurotus eryngii]
MRFAEVKHTKSCGGPVMWTFGVAGLQLQWGVIACTILLLESPSHILARPSSPAIDDLVRRVLRFHNKTPRLVRTREWGYLVAPAPPWAP